MVLLDPSSEHSIEHTSLYCSMPSGQDSMLQILCSLAMEGSVQLRDAQE